MQFIGGLFVLLGVASYGMLYLGRELMVLSWVDNWGPGVGNGIRIAMIAVGGVLWLLGRQSAARAAAPPS